MVKLWHQRTALCAREQKGHPSLQYRIEYSPESEKHLRALTARQRRTVLDTVDEQLAHQPAVETRNRRQMRPNRLAGWELRIGDLRVYYDIEADPKPVVVVNAVGVKKGNQIVISGEVVKFENG